MTTPAVQGQTDNLTIGIFLARRPYGAELDEILQEIGWAPGARPDRAHFERRFRYAQAIGRDARRDRRAGYFTWNAQRFGRIFVYKVTWYVWRNPQSSIDQTVPMFSADLGGMREFRDKYLDTLTATTRGIRAGHDLQELRDADARGDTHDVQFIQQRMVHDGGLGEVLSGYHGLPYADIEEIISQLPSHALGSISFNFQRSAKKIRRLQNELEKEQARISNQLSDWVKSQTGLPRNAYQLALQDAQNRLSRLRSTR